ncbi:FtsX-like permease family protein [Mumia sp. zg.B17]|uniref:ABC transporter permease n=1 Tax=Mumia sp. zg.B17 TaxID=2855446 RepID=UPI001C6E7D07|nr:ABC transporter permease [Mumia sp. zg.B17]MBW9204549.1 FtsX-like permease family protein [Mumia sp. zg.B17]
MRTVLWGSLRAHSRRYVTAVTAIVMSVAFMVAVNALSGSARDGLRSDVVAQYAGADLVVDTSADDSRTLDRLVDQIRAVDGVEGAVVNRLGFVEVEARSARQLMSVGTVAADRDLRWQEVTDGVAPQRPREALMAASSAKRYDVALGDTVRVFGQRGPVEVAITGFTTSPGGTLGSTVYVSEQVGSRLGDVLTADDVSVRVADTTAAATGKALRSAVGADRSERPVADREAWVDSAVAEATNDVDILQRMVLVFAAISAFVGTLVIASTITTVLAQRRRELALLRCVGATRRQIVRSLRLESLALGVAASTVGVLVGWGLGHATVAALRAWTAGISFGAVSLSPLGVGLPFALGVLVAVGATVLPARRIGRLTPLEALRPHETTGLSGGAGRIRVALGTVLVSVGGAGLVLGTGDLIPVGLAGGMTSFLGVVVLAPLLVPALLRLVGPVVGRSGVSGRLAADNVVRNPRRTASTATSLLIGVTLITMVVIGTASLRGSIDRDLDASYALDVGVVAAGGPLAEGVGDRVDGVDGVDSVATLPGGEVEMDGHRVLALEVSPAAARIVHGDTVVPGPGELVIGEELSTALDLSYGESARLRTTFGELDLRPRGGGSLGEVVLVGPGVLDELGVAAEPRAVWARGEGGAPEEQVMADTATVARSAGADVAGSMVQRTWIGLQLDVMLAVVVGLLAVAVLIAVVGMTGTLSLSILERSRENALLRALGLSRGGLRRTLAGEALLMAGVGAVLGTTLGGAYAWLGVRALTEGLVDDVAFSVPWLQVAIVLAATTATGLIASVVPARRATRVSPAKGIAML